MKQSALLLLSSSLCAIFVALPTIADATDLCQMERDVREAHGITDDGPTCQALQDPKSALSRATSFSEGDLFYCKVLLCTAAPDGPESIAECQGTMRDFRRRLRRGPSIPSCPLMWADDRGGGGVSARVDTRGNVIADERGQPESAYSVDDAGRERVARYGQSAYQTYGLVCNDVPTMISQMGRNTVGARGVQDQAWLRGGSVNSAFADWRSQPAWWRDSNPGLANHAAWDRLLPWFVVLELDDNNAGPATIEMGHMSVQYYSLSQRAWIVVDETSQFDASQCRRDSNYVDCASADVRSGPQGAPVFPNGIDAMNVHGWWNMLELPDPNDVGAINVNADARLVGENAGAARHGLMVGADLYPSWMTISGVRPGVGNSRIIPLESQWTTVSFTTLTTEVNNYGGGRGISANQLRLQPPPCAGPSVAATAAQ